MIATVNGRTAVEGVGSIDVLALLAVVVLFVFFALIGFFWSRRKTTSAKH